MDVGPYLVEAHLREGRRVADLARVHGVHRSWLYKLLSRYRAKGEAGLAPRSRRPHRSPTALPSELAEEVIRLRADLLAQGLDAGALTIQWHLARRGGRVPSPSSIVRVLRRRGLVVPQPHKRPRSSFIRFEAALPNQLWQTDATHWALADGSLVEILNVVDDHSRVLVAAVPLRTRPGHAAGGVRRQGESGTRIRCAAGPLPRALRHRRRARQGHPPLRLAPAPHRSGRAPSRQGHRAVRR